MAAFIRKVTKQTAEFPSTFLKAKLAVALVGLALGVLLFPGISLGQTVGDEIAISTNSDYPQQVGKAEVTAPCLAYDSKRDRFLVVWKKENGFYGYDLWGRFVGADGIPQGDPFAICEHQQNEEGSTHPQPVYDAKNDRFLVVWSDNRHILYNWRYWVVYGRYIAGNGSMGKEFAISPVPTDPLPDNFWSANHSYTLCDQGSGNFLVIMATASGGVINLKGKILGGSSGYLDITNFIEGYGVWRPVAAYDSANQRFLVAYGVDWINKSFIQILGADGSTLLEETEIAGPPKYVFNSAAFDPVYQRYLVLWSDSVYPDAQGYGRLLDEDGIPSGEVFQVLEGALDGTYDPANQKFLAVTSGYNHDSNFVIGQQLDLDGTPSGAWFAIQPEGEGNSCPYVAAGAQGRSLVVWSTTKTGEPSAVYGRIVEFTPPSPDVDLTGTWGPFTSSTNRQMVTTVKGSVTVRNDGTQDAGAFKVAYYLSNDTSQDGSDTLLKTAKVRSLVAGASTTLSFNWKGSGVKGKYIIAVVDSGVQVAETNEDNNTAVSAAIP